jgi:formiminoglutamase
MAAFEFKRFDQSTKKLNYLQRPGETRLGSVIQESKLNNAKYVLIGIEENAGPQANMGRVGSENAFNAFFRVFLNTQVHEEQTMHELAYLGKIVQLKSPQDQMEATSMVAELDELLFNTLLEHLRADQIPIIVGGGHNNALPLIRWAAQNAPISIVNIDAHADLRTTEKRHSGNSFSTAMQEGHIQQYGVFGLHEAFNNQWIREQLQQANCVYRFYEAYLQGPFQLQEDVSNFIQHQTAAVGLEIDMDAISNMPSSAQSPSGWRLDDIRSLIYKIGHLKPTIAYLNLTEAAPLNETDDLIVGKALTYLVRDFIKAMK